MPLDMTANANTTEVITSPLSMLYHWEQSRGKRRISYAAY